MPRSNYHRKCLQQIQPQSPLRNKRKETTFSWFAMLASYARTCVVPGLSESTLPDTARSRFHLRRSIPLTPASESLWRPGLRSWRLNKSSTPFVARASPSPPDLKRNTSQWQPIESQATHGSVRNNTNTACASLVPMESILDHYGQVLHGKV